MERERRKDRRRGCLGFFLLATLLSLAAAGCGSSESGASPQGAKEAKREAAFREHVDASCRRIRGKFAEAAWNAGAITAQGSMGIAGLESIKPPPSLAETFSKLLGDLHRREFARSYAAGNAYPAKFAHAKHQYRLYTTKAREDASRLGLHDCPFPLAPVGRSVFKP